MRRVIALVIASLLAASLSGCIIVPARGHYDYDHGGDGYRHGR